MNCKLAQPNLLEYSRGLLNPPVADAVRVHLAVCAECQSVLAEEVGLAGNLSALPGPSSVPNAWPLVQTRIETVLRPTEAFTLIFRPYARRLAAGLATVVLALTAGFGVMHWRSTTDQRATVQAMDLIQVQTSERPSSVDVGEGTTDAMMKVLQEQVPQGEM